MSDRTSWLAELAKYLDYVRNTGLVPLPVAMFEDDWEPIGRSVLNDLELEGFVEISPDGITITKAGKELLP